MERKCSSRSARSIGRQSDGTVLERRALGHVARPRRVAARTTAPRARPVERRDGSVRGDLGAVDRGAQGALSALRIGDDVETLVVLPLVAQGRAFGVFGLAFALPYRFEEMQRAFLIALADLCALCLLSSERADADAIREAERGVGQWNPGDEWRLRQRRSCRMACPRTGTGRASSTCGQSSGRDVKLTAREQEIAIALTQGLRSSAVARDLGISIYTVRKHISSILRKYDVTSQCELIARIYGQSPAPGDLEQSARAGA